MFQGRERRGHRDSDPTGAGTAAGTRNKGAGEEQPQAWHKPCPWCSCRAKLLEGSCGSRGSSRAGGAAAPPSLSRFPGAAERAWALLCPPPPAPEDSVHLLWIRLEAAPGWALMKPALESLSLGKGGVLQHQQPSGTAPALPAGPWPPPRQSPALHEQEHGSPCSPRGDFSHAAPSPARPGLPSFTWHNIPHFFNSMDFSMKHNLPSHCPGTELLPALGILRLQQPPGQGIQALSSQHVPIKSI